MRAIDAAGTAMIGKATPRRSVRGRSTTNDRQRVALAATSGTGASVRAANQRGIVRRRGKDAAGAQSRA
jgi:hypothetical protein